MSIRLFFNPLFFILNKLLEIFIVLICRLTANYHYEFLYELGADKDHDVYYNAAWLTEINASYAFNNNLTIFSDAVNLTNAPLKYYLGSQVRIKQQEYYFRWGGIGVYEMQFFMVELELSCK